MLMRRPASAVAVDLGTVDDDDGRYGTDESACL